MRLPGTVGIAGWVMQHREALMVDDTRQDTRFDNRVDAVSGMTTRSLMAVPLVSRGEVLGVIEAVNKLNGSFDSHDLDMLKTLASSAAIAIDNARLFTEELERAAALKRALEQQRELDRLQREFIQNVSHELRTPLALIRGHAEVLESGWMGELNAEQKESIGVIVRRSLMLTKLVNDIITVLEIEQRELVREPFDMVMLVRSVLTGFRPAAEQADLVLSAEIPPHLPLAYGDTLALRRALDNLLNNALKFTPAGGRITVRLYQIESNLMIEVADTGIGIPHDQLGRIFERFYQVDGSSTRKYGGIGLGLSLVKSIVEGHRGQVTLASTVRVGTTFTITLPLDEI
jgi:signal transduction histidine kinase